MTSATVGPILPEVAPAPLYGEDLDNFLQQFVVGVTGMSLTSVRPRWQPDPPNELPINSDWAAIGAIDFVGDTYAAEVHIPTGEGSSVVFRQEELEIVVSFYGPNAQRNASILREGLSVAQNREVLSLNDMSLKVVSNLRRVPVMKNDRWQERFDVRMIIVRAIRRKYQILNLESAEGSIVTDNDPPLTQPINVQEP